VIVPAKKLARLSGQAYDQHTFAAGGTEVLMKTVRKHTVMAFRGTTLDGLDILDDLRAYPWWSKEIRGFVHRGFLSGVRDIWSHLPIGGPNPMSVVLTGHSKGGAEAILFGAMLCALKIPPVQIETFGAPRVGFTGLGRLLKNIPGKRWRLGADIVPTRPLPFPFPYRHDRELSLIATDEEDVFKNHRIADYIKAV
jgi:predicted lipase